MAELVVAVKSMVKTASCGRPFTTMIEAANLTIITSLMPFGEADTRAKLIDPALHARGWTEDLIRPESDGNISTPRRRAARGRPPAR